MNDNDLQKSRELLRQGELRIKGILEFSSVLDEKIFKLLASSVAITGVLVFFILNKHANMVTNLFHACIFSLMLLCFVIVFLMMAGKPQKYKGVGLPLDNFISEKSLTQILFESKKRYEKRFFDNKTLNNKKSFWLKHAIYLFSFFPILSGLFYLSTFFAPIIVIISIWFVFSIVIYGCFRKFVI